MRDWIYHLGTSDPTEPRIIAEFESGDVLVHVYNLKDEKVYRVAVKDLSLEFDLLWYKGKWRYFMKKRKHMWEGK